MKKAFQTIAIVLIAVLGIRIFLFISCIIPSSGMENSLYRGDRVLVNRWSYGYRVPFMSVFGYHRWGSGKVERNDILLFNSPEKKQQGSTDSHDLFVSRCVGLPGDTLMLNRQLLLTNEKNISPEVKLLYAYSSGQEQLVQTALRELRIDNNKLLGVNKDKHIRGFSHSEIFNMRRKLGNRVQLISLKPDTEAGVHPFIVPSKGTAIRVYPWNVRLLCNAMTQHENRQAKIKNDTLYVDNRPVYWCQFTQNYYWMASNNPVNASDSRLFGFVPETHLIGRASLVWFSKDDEQNLFHGYRWNRFFSSVK